MDNDKCPPTNVGSNGGVAAWMPIATAPKDGKRIMVFEGGEAQIVAWRAMHYGRMDWGPDDGESVYCEGAFRPTHWMPLPAPPEAPNDRGNAHLAAAQEVEDGRE